MDAWSTNHGDTIERQVSELHMVKNEKGKEKENSS